MDLFVEIAKSLATESVKILCKKIVDVTFNRDKAITIEERMWCDIERQLSSHFSFVKSWAESLKVLSMPRPEVLSNKTIDLRYTSIPRSYAKTNSDSDTTSILNEKDVLTCHFNALILGEPGAGKTTTLQRLANSLYCGKVDVSIGYRYPLVLLVRELRDDESVNNPVTEEIAKTIGITSYLKSDSDNDNINKYVESFSDKKNLLLESLYVNF